MFFFLQLPNSRNTQQTHYNVALGINPNKTVSHSTNLIGYTKALKLITKAERWAAAACGGRSPPRPPPLSPPGARRWASRVARAQADHETRR